MTASIPAKKVSKKLTPRQKAMREAVDKLQDYVGTYDDQAMYHTYTDKTYVDDILYGLGLSMQCVIPTDYSGPGGYERFKQYLREHLK